MAGNKTRPEGASVDVHVDALDVARQSDARALIKLMHAATNEPPKMWGASIIGFGNYHYVYESGREGDMPLIGFSPRKAAVVLYIHAGLWDSATLLAKLGRHTTGKGCLYIKKLSDVDENVLAQVLARSVAAIRRKYPAGKS